MKLDSVLLSPVNSIETEASEIAFTQRRYKVQVLIVISLLFQLTCFGYQIFFRFYPLSPRIYLLMAAYSLLTVCSLQSLRRRYKTLAETLVMLSFHAEFFIIGGCYNIPLAALCRLIIFPNYCTLLGLSLKSIVANISICIIEAVWCLTQVWRDFRMTSDDNQKFQIYVLLVYIFCCLCHSIIICFMHKSVEMSIWKLAQDNLRKSKDLTDEKKEVLDSTDGFVKCLSNEMRDQLTSIEDSLGYLLQASKKLILRQQLRNIKLKSEAIRAMIVSILDASRPRQNQTESTRTRNNLVKIVEESLTVYTNIMQKRDVFTQVFVDRNLPQELWIDGFRLSQIFTNLISNSIKYVRTGGKVKIYLAWHSEDMDQIDCLNRIVDSSNERFLGQSQENLTTMSTNPRLVGGEEYTTVGESLLQEFSFQEHSDRQQNFRLLESLKFKSLEEIHNAPAYNQSYWTINQNEIFIESSQAQEPCSPRSTSTTKGYLKMQVTTTERDDNDDHINKIFELFDQRQPNSKPSSAVTDLGLWISKRLCLKMNGDIRIYKEADSKVTFVVCIPIDNNPILNIDLSSSSHKQGKLRALVVDTYVCNRNLHRMMLEKENVEVVLASNGKEALDIFVSHGRDYFDLVMMDTVVPDLDGYQVANRIQWWEQDQNWKKVNILFVSGEYLIPEEMMMKLRFQEPIDGAGKIDFLRKPIDFELLRKLLKSYKSRKEDSG